MKIIESFFLGILAALGALVLQVFFLLLATFFIGAGKNYDFDAFSLLNANAFPSSGYFPFFALPAIALVEELFKYLVIIKRVEPFHIGRSVILHSFLVGLGFAAMEIFIIYGSLGNAMRPAFPCQKILEIALVHIFTAGIIGFFVALKNPAKFSTALKAVLVAFSIHLLYNIMALFPNALSGALMAAFLTILLIINIFNLIGMKREFA